MSEHGAIDIELHLQYNHAFGDLAPYFTGLMAGKAKAVRCPACGQVWFPPKLSCPQDHTDTEWIELDGGGCVVSVTEGDSRLPLSPKAGHYVFAMIALDGADNLAFGRIVSDDAIRTGDRVRLTSNPKDTPHPAQVAIFIPVK